MDAAAVLHASELHLADKYSISGVAMLRNRVFLGTEDGSVRELELNLESDPPSCREVKATRDLFPSGSAGREDASRGVGGLAVRNLCVVPRWGLLLALVGSRLVSLDLSTLRPCQSLSSLLPVAGAVGEGEDVGPLGAVDRFAVAEESRAVITCRGRIFSVLVFGPRWHSGPGGPRDISVARAIRAGVRPPQESGSGLFGWLSGSDAPEQRGGKLEGPWYFQLVHRRQLSGVVSGLRVWEREGEGGGRLLPCESVSCAAGVFVGGRWQRLWLSRPGVGAEEVCGVGDVRAGQEQWRVLESAVSRAMSTALRAAEGLDVGRVEEGEEMETELDESAWSLDIDGVSFGRCGPVWSAGSGEMDAELRDSGSVPLGVGPQVRGGWVRGWDRVECVLGVGTGSIVARDLATDEEEEEEDDSDRVTSGANSSKSDPSRTSSKTTTTSDLRWTAVRAREATSHALERWPDLAAGLGRALVDRFSSGGAPNESGERESGQSGGGRNGGATALATAAVLRRALEERGGGEEDGEEEEEEKGRMIMSAPRGSLARGRTPLLPPPPPPDAEALAAPLPPWWPGGVAGRAGARALSEAGSGARAGPIALWEAAAAAAAAADAGVGGGATPGSAPDTFPETSMRRAAARSLSRSHRLPAAAAPLDKLPGVPSTPMLSWSAAPIAATTAVTLPVAIAALSVRDVDAPGGRRDWIEVRSLLTDSLLQRLPCSDPVAVAKCPDAHALLAAKIAARPTIRQADHLRTSPPASDLPRPHTVAHDAPLWLLAYHRARAARDTQNLASSSIIPSEASSSSKTPSSGGSTSQNIHLSGGSSSQNIHLSGGSTSQNIHLSGASSSSSSKKQSSSSSEISRVLRYADDEDDGWEDEALLAAGSWIPSAMHTDEHWIVAEPRRLVLLQTQRAEHTLTASLRAAAPRRANSTIPLPQPSVALRLRHPAFAAAAASACEAAAAVAAAAAAARAFDDALTLTYHDRWRATAEKAAAIRAQSSLYPSSSSSSTPDESHESDSMLVPASPSLPAPDPVSVRAQHALFGYQCFAEERFARAAAHLFAAGEPVASLLSLVPPLLPAGTVIRRRFPVEVRLLAGPTVDALLPAAAAALLPVLLAAHARLQDDLLRRFPATHPAQTISKAAAAKWNADGGLGDSGSYSSGGLSLSGSSTSQTIRLSGGSSLQNIPFSGGSSLQNIPFSGGSSLQNSTSFTDASGLPAHPATCDPLEDVGTAWTLVTPGALSPDTWAVGGDVWSPRILARARGLALPPADAEALAPIGPVRRRPQSSAALVATGVIAALLLLELALAPKSQTDASVASVVSAAEKRQQHPAEESEGPSPSSGALERIAARRRAREAALKKKQDEESGELTRDSADSTSSKKVSRHRDEETEEKEAEMDDDEVAEDDEDNKTDESESQGNDEERRDEEETEDESAWSEDEADWGEEQSLSAADPGVGLGGGGGGPRAALHQIRVALRRVLAGPCLSDPDEVCARLRSAGAALDGGDGFVDRRWRERVLVLCAAGRGSAAAAEAVAKADAAIRAAASARRTAVSLCRRNDLDAALRSLRAAGWNEQTTQHPSESLSATPPTSTKSTTKSSSKSSSKRSTQPQPPSPSSSKWMGPEGATTAAVAGLGPRARASLAAFARARRTARRSLGVVLALARRLGGTVGDRGLPLGASLALTALHPSVTAAGIRGAAGAALLALESFRSNRQPASFHALESLEHDFGVASQDRPVTCDEIERLVQSWGPYASNDLGLRLGEDVPVPLGPALHPIQVVGLLLTGRSDVDALESASTASWRDDRGLGAAAALAWCELEMDRVELAPSIRSHLATIATALLVQRLRDCASRPLHQEDSDYSPVSGTVPIEQSHKAMVRKSASSSSSSSPPASFSDPQPSRPVSKAIDLRPSLTGPIDQAHPFVATLRRRLLVVVQHPAVSASDLLPLLPPDALLHERATVLARAGRPADAVDLLRPFAEDARRLVGWLARSARSEGDDAIATDAARRLFAEHRGTSQAVAAIPFALPAMPAAEAAAALPSNLPALRATDTIDVLTRHVLHRGAIANLEKGATARHVETVNDTLAYVLSHQE